MVFAWTLLMGLSIVIGWSIWMRVCRCRSNNINQIAPKPSPLSIAVQEIIATAGGIYLSLVMVVSFLKLDIPEKVSMINVSIDPLAFTAIILAIVQPLFFNVFK